MILFWKDGFLAAQRFDPDSGEVRGQVIPIADGVEYTSWETPVAAVSNEGTLVYQPALSSALVRIAWLDREGNEVAPVELGKEQTEIDEIRLSPDGRSLLFAGTAPRAGAPELWIRDLERGTDTRVTFDPASEWNLSWSPDGKTIYFNSDRDSAGGIFSIAATGEGETRAIADLLVTRDLFPDGESLLVQKDRRTKIERYSLAKGEVTSLGGDIEGQWPRVSPDGNWVAYESLAADPEIFVSRVDRGGKWQISSGGGTFPVWSRDGRELYFVDNQLGSIWSAEIDTTDGLRFTTPKKLFDLQFKRGEFVPYDVSPNGDRFLVNTYGEEAFSTPLALVQNWAAGLKE